MSEQIASLSEIKSVLLKTMAESPHYNVGTAAALLHLTAHVAAAVDEIDRRLKALEERA